MSRSAGITFSAVVVFIGSAFTILLAGMMLLGAAVISHSMQVRHLPAAFGYIVIVEAIFFFGFAAWGVATGIGLIRTKHWARISMLVFSAFLLMMTLPAMLIMAVIPLPSANNPHLPANFLTIIRVALILFYGFFAALGGFWVYFFTRRSVKEEFQRQLQAAYPLVAAPSFAYPPGALPSAVPGPIRSARPVSITIIGWFLLIGSALGPLSIPLMRVFFPGVPVPVSVFGVLLFGPSAFLILVVYSAVQVIAAVGLLRLKMWGRSLAIAMQSLGFVNAVLLFALPGNRLKFQQMMQAMYASMAAQTHQAVPVLYPWWFGLASSLPIFAVILWFLITRKDAFTAAARQSATEL